MTVRTAAALLLAGLSLGACTSEPASESTAAPAAQRAPADQFLAALKTHCGKAYAGRVVSTDKADADMMGKPLIMHVRGCEQNRVEIPFHVGDDRSRTWIITRTDTGLRLKHDHRHEDGSVDKVTMYGGDTANAGTATRQEFPVDAESITTFRANGLDQSVTNIWAVEANADTFAYELKREGRFFRVEFDLTKPVAVPPAPWGWE